jgi:DNA-binding LacI/PurR family transcriptional regulator
MRIGDLGAATLKDVARTAGVSRDTASVVLNRSRSNTRVSDETRHRILQVAHDLHYHPNGTARGLARRRMNTVGILFGLVNHPVASNHYVLPILEGVMSAAGAAEYNVTLFTRGWESGTGSLGYFNDRRTDGIIAISPPTDSDMLPSLAALSLPLIVIDWPHDGVAASYVYCDDAVGARVATEHLLSLGHRRIAHLAGTINKASAPVRRGAFEDTLRAGGITPPPEYLVSGSYRAETTYADTRRLLALPEPPTAIFAGNDVMAAEALRAARDAGVSVPQQLSIIGYDDAPIAVMTNPPLTTVHAPRTAVGEEAARRLIARIEGENAPPTIRLLTPELVVRDSTAPPPAPSP